VIVKPDFLDHYKTRKLCNLLRDPAAALYLIRLWSFCEMRKTSRFPTNDENIKAMCNYKGRAKTLVKKLEESGFLHKQEKCYLVHEWDEYNKSLLTSCANGAKNKGKAKKVDKPGDTRGSTQDPDSGEPTGNPRDTAGGDEKSREEKSRGDSPPEPPEGGPCEGDLAHKIMKARPELRALTYEQDLSARKNFMESPVEINWPAVAGEVVDRAVRMGNIKHPGSWLLVQYDLIVRRMIDEQKKESAPLRVEVLSTDEIIEKANNALSEKGM
jgi:hypothetical protein